MSGIAAHVWLLFDARYRYWCDHAGRWYKRGVRQGNLSPKLFCWHCRSRVESENYRD